MRSTTNRDILAMVGAALLASVLLNAGCHDLELARLRCSTSNRCPDGYACGTDGFCTRTAGGGGDGGVIPVQTPPGSTGKKQGESCTRAGDCATGSCADGVCCNSACGDACHACNLPNNVGTCVAVGRGEASRHGGCAKQDPASCGNNGLCDGAGQCQRYDTTTVCRQPTCSKVANALTPDARCDGQGKCASSGQALSCAPFVCRDDGSGCADSCNGNGNGNGGRAAPPG